MNASFTHLFAELGIVGNVDALVVNQDASDGTVDLRFQLFHDFLFFK
jgi:hypothetical protein